VSPRRWNRPDGLGSGVPEPSAGREGPQTVLVFDLGESRVDVSIVESNKVSYSRCLPSRDGARLSVAQLRG
jgi:hypothetical protein